MILSSLDSISRTILKIWGFESYDLATSHGLIRVIDGKGFGSFPPIVLVHGIGAQATGYLSLISKLRSSFQRIITLDLIAHGKSEVPKTTVTMQTIYEAMDSALSQIVKSPMILLGNSLGGAICLRFAVDHPESVSGLILISPGGAPMTSDQLQELKEVFYLDSKSKALEFLRRLMYRPSPFAPLVTNELQKIYLSRPIRDFFASLDKTAVFDPLTINNLTCRCCVLWGIHDEIIPINHLEFFRKHLPKDTKIYELEKLGHSPFIENPKLIAKYIINFLK